MKIKHTTKVGEVKEVLELEGELGDVATFHLMHQGLDREEIKERLGITSPSESAMKANQKNN